jgi:hypothetical protein
MGLPFRGRRNILSPITMAPSGGQKLGLLTILIIMCGCVASNDAIVPEAGYEVVTLALFSTSAPCRKRRTPT